MLNRAAVILKYKEPFITWINESDPYKKDLAITLDKSNDDRTVYLITEEDSEHLEKWISLNFSQLFESELEDWYTDESLWPKKRTIKLFDKWFSVECHTLIIDTVGGVIFDEETD